MTFHEIYLMIFALITSSKDFEMKALIISSIALFSSAVMAMPAVGDSASYTITADGQTLTQKIQLTAFNPSTNTFTQLETTTFQGQTQQETSSVAASDLMSDAQADYILSKCTSAEIGGTLERITTPAGTFNTCAVTDETGSAKLNVGKVPFGLVAISGDGLSGILTGFTRGK